MSNIVQPYNIADFLTLAKSIKPNNIKRLYPGWERKGTVAVDHSRLREDGLYTGATLGATTNPFGERAWNTDGGDFMEADGTILTDFNFDLGSLAIIVKPSGASYYTEEITRYLFQFFFDADNRFHLEKTSDVSPVYRTAFRGGGTNRSISTGVITDTDWILWILTWRTSATIRFELFYNGVSQGSVANITTWDAPSSMTLNIGSNNTHTLTNIGGHAHFILWDDVLVQAEIDRMAGFWK